MSGKNVDKYEWIQFETAHKAKLLKEGIFFLILLMKKLEIEKTMPTFVISVLKVEY